MKEKENKEKIKRVIKEIGNKYGTQKVFSDFVICASYAFANAANYNQDREDRFNNIIKEYDINIKDIFAKMLANLYESYANEECIDVLGEIYEELNLSNKTNGQFFTPMHICKLMSDITLDQKSIENDIKNKGYFTISDPACGSGRLLYSSFETLKKNKIPNNQLLIIGDDVDLLCCCMTYVGLTLMGANAIINHKDTLLNKTYDTFYTINYVANKELQNKIITDCKKEEMEIMG